MKTTILTTLAAGTLTLAGVLSAGEGKAPATAPAEDYAALLTDVLGGDAAPARGVAGLAGTTRPDAAGSTACYVRPVYGGFGYGGYGYSSFGYGGYGYVGYSYVTGYPTHGYPTCGYGGYGGYGGYVVPSYGYPCCYYAGREQADLTPTVADEAGANGPAVDATARALLDAMRAP